MLFSSRKDEFGEEWSAQVYGHLLKEGVVFLSGPVGEGQANLVIARLIYLEHQGPDAGISLYISSPGGEAGAALTIYDTMQLINRDIRTVCVGVADGVAALILAAGTKGKRFAYPHARIRIMHHSEGNLRGTTAEIDVRARQLLKLRQQVNEILARHTGQPMERIERDADRGFWLSAAEARDYGLIDEIVVPGRAQ